jgi:hypothetical protein
MPLGAKKQMVGNFKELAIGLEIFNLFNKSKCNMNTWVRDAYSKNEYAIQIICDTCFLMLS